METNIKEIIYEYQKNKNKLKKYKSYINQVTEYEDYIIKEYKDRKKAENELMWLKKLNALDYDVPKIIDIYNNIIVMEKIEGQTINDDNAKEHLYNIGQLMANLHKSPIEIDIDYKKILKIGYNELKNSVKDIMENHIYETVTKFIESELEKIEISEISIIHKDIRPENIIYSKGKYYLLDLELMEIGDIDYDFIRILNLLNEKQIYQYEDFKNLMDGYKSIKNVNLKKEKWQLYNKLYAFRLYSRMLIGKINRDSKYEEYLKNILISKHDRVTEWIKKYNMNK